MLANQVAEFEKELSREKSTHQQEHERMARSLSDAEARLQASAEDSERLVVEQGDEIGRLKKENRDMQAKLKESEMNVKMIKGANKDELQRVIKENNMLTERLRKAEDAVQQSELGEAKRLGTSKEQAKALADTERKNAALQNQLQESQNYIKELETQLQEEMSRHAPLYGANLDQLSLEELDTLARIHDEGLRQVQQIQMRLAPPPAQDILSQNHSHGPTQSVNDRGSVNADPWMRAGISQPQPSRNDSSYLLFGNGGTSSLGASFQGYSSQHSAFSNFDSLGVDRADR